MHRRIILSGVHGVGKGYFIHNKLANIRNLTVVSASEIIEQYHDADDAGNKRVKDVADNQRILLEALKSYFEKHGETVLLDGHLVILDSKDNIQRIPVSFFVEGMFDTIILLQDKAHLIYDRMYERDGIHKLELDLISKMQKEELDYAKELNRLGIEVFYLKPSSDEMEYLNLFREDGTNGIC